MSSVDGRVLPGTGQARDQAAQRDAGAAGVAERHVVRAGRILHERLHERRGDRDDQALRDGAPQDHAPGRHAGDLEDHRDHRGHVERHMPRQVDVLEAGRHRQQDVHDHAEEEDQGRLGAVLHEYGTDDGLIVRHDALHVERVLEHAAEGVERAGDDRRSGGEHQESDERADGALHDVGGLLALHGQADQRNQGHDDGRLTENVKQNR